jgi:hypothetical protein
VTVERKALGINPEPAMSHSQSQAGANRPVRALSVATLSLAALFVLLAATQRASGQNVIRVEEDWELQIGEPDLNSTGPQVLTTMSPNPDLLGTYFTLEINHRSAPTFSGGGISIHRWFGEARYASYDRVDRTTMQTSNEVVTWTQALYRENGRVYFNVINGVSSTWGPFGYSNLMRLDNTWSSDNINGYTPAVSVAESGAPYAANRVRLLKIKAIRMTFSDASVVTDNTERIVQQLVE